MRYTYKVSLKSEVTDSTVYTSMKKAVDSAKDMSNRIGCDALVIRDDGIEMAFVSHHYVDSSNVYHRATVTKLN